MTSICGIDCLICPMNEICKGCAATDGKPFGGECIVAECVKSGGDICCMKKKICAEINALGIIDMDEVTELYALRGAFINLEYTLPGGEKTKFFDDDRIYLGVQMPKKGTDRCYGMVADNERLLVCEYGEGGANPEIIIFKKRC